MTTLVHITFLTLSTSKLNCSIPVESCKDFKPCILIKSLILARCFVQTNSQDSTKTIKSRTLVEFEFPQEQRSTHLSKNALRKALCFNRNIFFLCNKKTCLLRQEHISSCSTRTHVFLHESTFLLQQEDTFSSSARTHFFFLSESTCLLVQRKHTHWHKSWNNNMIQMTTKASMKIHLNQVVQSFRILNVFVVSWCSHVYEFHNCM